LSGKGFFPVPVGDAVKKNMPFVVGLLSLLLPLGCGDEESIPPVLTEIRYQSSAYQFGFPDGQGSAPLAGRVSFEDPDRDLAVLHVRWRDCGRGPVKELDLVQKDPENPASGSIPFVTVISTNCPVGEYTVEVSASDGQGNTSNTLVAPYRIYE
jgi:hypothetical protein